MSKIVNLINAALIKEMPVGEWHVRQVNPFDVAQQLKELILSTKPERKPEMSDAMWDFSDTLEGRMSHFDIASNEKRNQALDEWEIKLKELFK